MAPFCVISPSKKVTVPNIEIAPIICSSRNLISLFFYFSAHFLILTCLPFISGFQQSTGTSIKMPVKSVQCPNSRCTEKLNKQDMGITRDLNVLSG